MPTIRAFQPGDIDGIYDVALATGAAGHDASGLYGDHKLVGHVYAAPYGLLAPESALVVDHDGAVAGYIVGPSDTRAFDAALEASWWPALRAQYPDPVGTPRASWSADQHLIAAIHHPWPTPPEIVEPYPSHLHINLLPPLQGQGMGVKLIDRWLDLMRAAGSRGAHLGVGVANERAVGFYRRYGFHEVQVSARTPRGVLWFAIDLR